MYVQFDLRVPGLQPPADLTLPTNGCEFGPSRVQGPRRRQISSSADKIRPGILNGHGRLGIVDADAH
jgi:hypothetical protein